MKIGKDGTIEASNADPLGLTNEEIIFMYLSTRGAYLSHRKEVAKKKKQAKMIKTLIENMDEDDGATIVSKGIGGNSKETKEEMLAGLQKASESLDSGNANYPYIKSIFVKLFPYWVILRESAEDMVHDIIKKCFNEESDVVKKMLTEEELD